MLADILLIIAAIASILLVMILTKIYWDKRGEKKMGFFKTPEENEEMKKKKEEEEWKKSAAYKFGLSQGEEREILKSIYHAETDMGFADNLEKLSDIDFIDKLFPNLSPKDKLKVFYYGHYSHDIIYRDNKESTYCLECGTDVEEEHRFCPACGKNEFGIKIESTPKKMQKKWKASIIILTIVACLSLMLLSAQILDVNISGLVSVDKNQDSTIVEKQNPIVTATSDVTAGTAPLTVQFYGEANNFDGSIVEWWWYFNDDISTLQNPSYTFENEGYYEVRVLVIDDAGSVEENIIHIKVNAPPPPEPPTYQDEEFRSWIKTTSSDIAYYMEQRLYAGIDAIYSGDYTKHKEWAQLEKDRYEQALLEIDNFKLSEYCNDIREDLKLAYSNYITAMNYYIDGDWDNAGIYEDIGTDYAEKVARKL